MSKKEKGGIEMKVYLPEGRLINTPENNASLSSISALRDAYMQGHILEARVTVCDRFHDLYVDLGCMRGVIPREEGAVGIDDGSVRDIALISRVNKPVCFKITGFRTDDSGRYEAVLSRRAVQKSCLDQYISALTPGDIIDARVTHLEYFGAFADIGAGIVSLLPVDSVSVSRISHPSDRIRAGQDIKVVVKSIDDTGRVNLSHKELLGTWEENAAMFEAGETVSGIIRSVESYGVFVELTPNLAGLAESCEGARVGQQASVYIKSLIPERMKIKLIIVDCFDDEGIGMPPTFTYYIDGGHIDKWRYSPDGCEKEIMTDFSCINPDGE